MLAWLFMILALKIQYSGTLLHVYSCIRTLLLIRIRPNHGVLTIYKLLLLWLDLLHIIFVSLYRSTLAYRLDHVPKFMKEWNQP